MCNRASCVRFLKSLRRPSSSLRLMAAPISLYINNNIRRSCCQALGPRPFDSFWSIVLAFRPALQLPGGLMEVASIYAGSLSKPLTCEVTWRHAMNYAAAVHDQNPWYFDDERDEGIVAPPMLAV